MIRNYKDLKVYQSSYSLAGELFLLSKRFPREELYSLTDQLRRSSRSIPANIAEGWSKRSHIKIFRRHLLDAIGSCDETKVWLDFSKDCKYITDDEYTSLQKKYEELSKMLNGLFNSWQTFER